MFQVGRPHISPPVKVPGYQRTQHWHTGSGGSRPAPSTPLSHTLFRSTGPGLSDHLPVTAVVYFQGFLEGLHAWKGPIHLAPGAESAMQDTASSQRSFGRLPGFTT